MARKPRIEIKIVTDAGALEFSDIKGRELPDGSPAPGPTEEHYAIAFKAVSALLGTYVEKHVHDEQGISNCEPCINARVRLWDAINRYVIACGGDPSKHVYGNTSRMNAVTEVESIAFLNARAKEASK